MFLGKILSSVFLDFFSMYQLSSTTVDTPTRCDCGLNLLFHISLEWVGFSRGFLFVYRVLVIPYKTDGFSHRLTRDEVSDGSDPSPLPPVTYYLHSVHFRLVPVT